jgi:hypothetical protein
MKTYQKRIAVTRIAFTLLLTTVLFGCTPNYVVIHDYTLWTPQKVSVGQTIMAWENYVEESFGHNEEGVRSELVYKGFVNGVVRISSEKYRIGAMHYLFFNPFATETWTCDLKTDSTFGVGGIRIWVNEATNTTLGYTILSGANLPRADKQTRVVQPRIANE